MAKGKVAKTVETLGQSLGQSLGQTLGQSLGQSLGQTGQTLGEHLREQRLNAQLSLRQLAEQTGVSNPYLSQIERGLRRPSAEVLQQLAKALRVSAEQLYVHAGLLNPDEDGVRSVELAILADSGLTERQKQALLDVYASFRSANTRPHEPDNPGAAGTSTTDRHLSPVAHQEEG